ncbi:MAG: hypothetical protein CVU50_06790 [Candidatus Cloacimonetes bacterium HGW-Cloacimonetes-3]|jgi:hypothetical protein|nr:MAG: hypothetical protein CVU50_06790 [Candidatus Cloacimonetes bacterium HGW-Cloacimonetes-3]
MMLRRTMQDYITKAAKGFPVITITGPRQSGKTTLAKMQFPDYTYYDLEDPDLRLVMEENPKSLFKDPLGKYIIDEFQYVPSLLSHIKVMVDKAQISAQFVLTGSSQFQMMGNLSQSLAGRTAIFQLLPFSYAEVYKQQKPTLEEVLFQGFYPRLIDKGMNPQVFYTSYINTYLERDIRLLSKVHDLNLFHKFISLCAGRTGCIFNKAALANETGIDVKTVSNWLFLLQTSFIIYFLQPWHSNVNKRMIKSPKLYFYDTGLVCRLLKIRESKELENHPLKGQIFETFVISEYLKKFYNQGLEAPLYFYRDSNGNEVDLIIQNGADLQPIEIKSAQSYHPGFQKNINVFRKVSGSTCKATIVYAGEMEWETNNTEIVPYTNLR